MSGAAPEETPSPFIGPCASVLARVQRGLESLYRVQTCLDVDAFMVDEEARNEALGSEKRRPREQLLVAQAGEELSLALFLDEEALANLRRHDPAGGLSEHNFWDFCLAVEGVSHFIYVAVCAASDRSVTALELELQAEVDKFVSCTLVQGGSAWPTTSTPTSATAIGSPTIRRGATRCRWSGATSAAAASTTCWVSCAGSTAWACRRSCST